MAGKKTPPRVGRKDKGASPRERAVLWYTLPVVVSIFDDTPPPHGDPAVDPSDDPRFPDQGHLDPAPEGIDAEWAWGFSGGDGAGQSIVDLEQGWTLNHEDLIAQDAKCLFGTLLDTSRPHGSSVL